MNGIEIGKYRLLTADKMEIKDFQNCLQQLLLFANCYESRFFNTVVICSEVMGQRGLTRIQGRIHIHVELSKQKPPGKKPPEYLDEWERKLRPLIARDGHRFKVFLWESIPGRQTMYDSYILTDQCGIFLHRLDCRSASHANSTDWNLLGEDTRIKRLQDYDPVMSPFRLVCERKIT